ncbi:ATP-dependent 6-phosphofructokinase 1 [Capsicum baccatum]|uniref:ATP-dependent 6-phosphofructokinase 1 n=1 Tax=Capsicum baccatum TaxID=33114 RepID=A0A2G2VBI0_CAPBA|nr:ATP-dependent 6-phosphofructokinase 1 [Capsicum baccatum]
MWHIDSCDVILDASRHDHVEPQKFCLWHPTQMLTSAIGDAARYDRIGPLFWDSEHDLNIKFRCLKPLAQIEYFSDIENLNAEDYPMVLLQIPMCNERKFIGILDTFIDAIEKLNVLRDGGMTLLCYWSYKGNDAISPLIISRMYKQALKPSNPIINKSFVFNTIIEKAQFCINASHVEAQSAENDIGLVKLMGRYSGDSGAAAVCLFCILEKQIARYGGQEDALQKNFQPEVLDGNNKYKCENLGPSLARWSIGPDHHTWPEDGFTALVPMAWATIYR